MRKSDTTSIYNSPEFRQQVICCYSNTLRPRWYLIQVDATSTLETNQVIGITAKLDKAPKRYSKKR